MLRRTGSMFTAALLAGALLLGGCGIGGGNGGDDGGSSGETTTETSETESTTTVPEEEVGEEEVDRSVEIEPVGDDGVEGSVEVLVTEDESVEMSVELEHTTETRGAQVLIGSCDEAVEGQAGSLLAGGEGYVLPDIEDGTMEATVDLPQSMVGKGDYALAIYEDDGTDGDVAGCAQVTIE